ncbi:MAG: CPBP family intramembrane metalloprotease [Acidimicrobiales bacterium]|nr:CPBP family intramembrane metalloprotease [Acidimicrobiales bacterium]
MSIAPHAASAAGRNASVLTTRRSLVLALSGLTALVELADVMGALPGIEIGGLTLSTSLIPSLALALACGSRLLGRSTLRHAAVGFWVTVGVLLPVLSLLYLREGRLELVPSLILAALNEELVYRLAVPAVIAAALRLGKVRPGPARIAGLTGAALWWCLLPGHVEQMTSPAGLLPYAAFAGLSAFIVYRSGSILPMAIGHAISNLLTVLMWKSAVPADLRSIGLACCLGLLVLAYGRSSRITFNDDGGLIDVHTGLDVTAIDLRDGQAPLVELADGRLIPVHAKMVCPPGLPARKSPERAS